MVLRGGRLRYGNYVATANVSLEWDGVYGLSVASAPGMTKLELAIVARLPYDVIRVTDVGTLRSLGYDVVPTEEDHDRNHALLHLPGEPTREDWERLNEAFGPVEPNPAKA